MSGATPVASIRALLASGYAAGAWNGPGIISSVAAANPNAAIGYAESSTLFSAFPADFRGQSVDESSIVGGYTIAGDATLDRSVNLADFNALAANFGQSNRTYGQGDFNYDAVVDLIDFNVLALHFGQSSGPERLTQRTAGSLSPRPPVFGDTLMSANHQRDDAIAELLA
jgi:hypothetical protein